MGTQPVRCALTRLGFQGLGTAAFGALLQEPPLVPWRGSRMPSFQAIRLCSQLADPRLRRMPICRFFAKSGECNVRGPYRFRPCVLID